MIRNFNNVFKMNGIKMRKTEHALAIKNIKDFFLSDVSMVDDFTQALLELAEAMPREPFSTQYIEELSSFAVDSGIFATIVSIFAQAGHTEILPYATTYLKKETVPRYQLKFAAAIALLGEESGYQFIESFFKRFMNKEPGLENFDFEWFVYVFETILTNERGQEMITRFRDEADYHVVWIDSNTESKDLE